MRSVTACSVVEYRKVDMTEPHRPRVKYVIGPDCSPLTIADLPAPGTKRWVIRRKAEVVTAVRGGLLSLEEACSRYTLSVDRLALLDRPPRFRGRCRSCNGLRGVSHRMATRNRGRARRGCDFDQHSDCGGRRI